MKYDKTQMFYRDYKWKTPENYDNPFIKKGKEQKEMDRTNGYEVLHFINELVPKYWPANVRNCQRIEAMIRNTVPQFIKDKKRIENWIINNW